VERALTPLLEAVLKPISEVTPAGADASYEDAFQALKAEVDKLSSASGTADFDRVVTLGAKVVSEMSKDLSAVCYLAIGLNRTQGYAGLAEGLAAVRHLNETYWEDLYPPARRMKARRNALQFLIERVRDWMEQNRATPEHREALEWAVEEVAALQAHATDAMGDEAPAFSLVARQLREALQRLPSPEPPPDSGEPAPTDAPSAGAPPAPAPSTPPPPPSAAGDAAGGALGDLRSAADATRAVTRVAAFLREQSPYDATAFALMRAARWGPIVQLPPNQGGKTLLEAPPAARRAALTNLAMQGPFDAAVREAEGAFPQSPFHFWLDLQRLLAGALGSLGAPATPARDAVVSATLALVHRLPQLPALTFSDGTPFADPLTVDWLAELSSARGGGEAPGARADDGLQEAVQEARALLASGDLPAALRHLNGEEGPPAVRLRRRLAAADLCFRGGRADVARAVLEGIDETVRRHELEAWEPALALDALRLLHRCYGALGQAAPAAEKPALRERADAVFERVCRLDPAVALAG
jgi:type VI secretion system protein VasJ